MKEEEKIRKLEKENKELRKLVIERIKQMPDNYKLVIGGLK